MEKFTKEEVNLLAKMLMIELTDEEAKALVEDKTMVQLTEFVEAIDTEGVDMMHLPFEEETNWLREDEVSHVVEKEKMLKNAPKTDGEFIEIVQVIDKND